MPVYAVESKRQAMLATGVVNAVKEWVEVNGKRQRSDEQKTVDGAPVWAVEVTYKTISFGDEATVTAPVEVPSAEKPDPSQYTPVEFAGLSVDLYVNRKTGQYRESWSAEGLESFTPANAKNDAAPKTAEKSAA